MFFREYTVRDHQGDLRTVQAHATNTHPDTDRVQAESGAQWGSATTSAASCRAKNHRCRENKELVAMASTQTLGVQSAAAGSATK